MKTARALVATLAMLGLFLVIISASNTPVRGEALGGWVQTTTYPITPQADTSCVVYSGYVYCVGASDTSGATYYAPISSSGIGSWKATTSYPFTVTFTNCAVYSGDIYCFGGEVAGGDTASVYYAPLSSNGIGTWNQATSLPAESDNYTCVVSGSYVYCVGAMQSYSGTLGASAHTYYGAISGGTISWASGNDYPSPVNSQSCAAYSGYIYCVGNAAGYESPPTVDATGRAVYSASLSASGFGAWQNETVNSPYPMSVAFASCLTNSGYLYCVGGVSSGALVYYASVSSGTVGSWTETIPFPDNTIESCVTSGADIYCMASGSGSQTYYDAITSGGTVTVTSTVTTTVTSPTTITSTVTSTATTTKTSTVTSTVTQSPSTSTVTDTVTR
ncbi:MAG: hypothetical protein JRN09_09590, partial [Nitrososphaerota archaeon]|nr:hypothetical protein [Nitrososphaerota archaeon]